MANANDPKAPPPAPNPGPASASGAKPATPPPAARPPGPGGNARPATPPPAQARRTGFRLDPAGIMLGVGAAVLLVALWILWKTPRADQAGDQQRLAQIEERLSKLEPQAAAAAATRQSVDALDARLRALEARPAPDIAALRGELAGLAQKVAALPAPPNTDQLASRQALEALANRVQGAEAAASQAANQRVAQLEQQLGQRLAALDQQLGQRATALEQRLGERASTLEDQVKQRAEALSQQVTQRTEALSQQVSQRSDALTQQVSQRTDALTQQVNQRLAPVEQAAQRMAALDQRTTRIAALERVQASLEAGKPLGPALQDLGQAPEALTRFANQAPPTEASLKLSFEQAAKAAREAADPGTSASGDRGSVTDAALARLSALVTVRRGEQVVWGDAAEAELEKARRALDAGDVALAVEHVGKLPPSAQKAMQGWTQQAKALLDARAAMRQMVSG